MSILSTRNLSYRVDGRPLVDGASFSLREGERTFLIGPNGAGKTTLVRLALGLLPSASGTAMLGGTDVSRLSPVERARRVAYLPQDRSLAWPQPVRDVVALGRFAHGGGTGRLTADDRTMIDHAMKDCGLDGLEDRAIDTLSGGERARVHMARAFASAAPLLVADEPIAALDPRYQHELMHLFLRLTEGGRTVLAIVHDLALAARYADRLLWMQAGRIVADGPPHATMTADRLRDVFSVKARVSGDKNVLHVEITGPIA
ncbi:MAG: ABC transporter ATP-binding protein [Pseudomonadota bacterium]